MFIYVGACSLWYNPDSLCCIFCWYSKTVSFALSKASILPFYGCKYFVVRFQCTIVLNINKTFAAQIKFWRVESIISPRFQISWESDSRRIRSADIQNQSQSWQREPVIFWRKKRVFCQSFSSSNYCWKK